MPFVLRDGKIRSAQPADPLSFAPPATLDLYSSRNLTYAEMYRSQPAIRTVVGYLARNLASLGLDVFERLDDNDRRKNTMHPLSLLLHRPFPGTKWTKYKLINWTVSEICIYDCAYWVKGLSADGELALFPIPRRFINPVGDNPLAPDKYRIVGNKGQFDLNPDQLVHFYGYNPDDPRNGTPPIETLRQVLAEEYAATHFREQMWRNGARLGGVLTRPKDARKWSDEARARFSAEWRAYYSGDGPEAGGTAVLEEGMDYKQIGITPKDAQYIESRKLTREEVAIAYHINPIMLGVAGSNQSAAREVHNWTYQDCLGPWTQMLAQDIEAQLLPDVDPLGAIDGSTYVEFNMESKMRGSFEAQAAAISSSVGGPWMTRSEARARFNLPHLPEADELVVPMNVTEGGLASPRDTAPDNPQNEESNGQPPAPRPAT
ncbi:MAG: phage portal protein [Actinomycetota bacterium]|nr:phage portal protein [Actinomycetota bacterium]